MDAYEWIFLVSMIAVWLLGSALIRLFGLHFSHIQEGISEGRSTLRCPALLFR